MPDKDFNRRGGLYRLAKFVLYVPYHMLFRIKITGRENIPREGAVVLCANHTSMHDVPLLGLISPRQVHFVAKDEFFKGWFLRRLFLGLGAIAMNREKPTIPSLKAAVTILKEERVMGIYLQGGRRKTIDVDEAKGGVALFAIKGRARIVPIHINAVSQFRLFSKIIINIGEPISLEEHYGARVNAELLDGIARDVIAKISALGEISATP